MADADEEKRKAAMAACQEMQDLCVLLCISPSSPHHGKSADICTS